MSFGVLLILFGLAMIILGVGMLVAIEMEYKDFERKALYDPYYSGGTFNPYDGPHGPCFREIDSYNPYAESHEGKFGVEDKYKKN